MCAHNSRSPDLSSFLDSDVSAGLSSVFSGFVSTASVFVEASVVVVSVAADLTSGLESTCGCSVAAEAFSTSAIVDVDESREDSDGMRGDRYVEPEMLDKIRELSARVGGRGAVMHTR